MVDEQPKNNLKRGFYIVVFLIIIAVLLGSIFWYASTRFTFLGAPQKDTTTTTTIITTQTENQITLQMCDSAGKFLAKSDIFEGNVSGIFYYVSNDEVRTYGCSYPINLRDWNAARWQYKKVHACDVNGVCEWIRYDNVAIGVKMGSEVGGTSSNGKPLYATGDIVYIER